MVTLFEAQSNQLRHTSVLTSLLWKSQIQTTGELFSNDYIYYPGQNVILISLQNVSGGPPALRSTIWKTAKVKHMPPGYILLIYDKCSVYFKCLILPGFHTFLQSTGNMLFLLFAIVVYRCYVASQRYKISHRVLKNKAQYDFLCNHSNNDLFMLRYNLLSI